MQVTSKLNRLALRYDYTIVCDDIKSAIVEHKVDKEFGTKMSKWGVELLNPTEYTKEELLKKYNGNEIVVKWVDTYTENNEPAMAVVLKN